MRNRKILLFIVILSFWVNKANAEITTNWGDVIDVNYSLWEDAAHTMPIQDNIDVDLTYIYLSEGSTVPPYISEVFPTASASYILKFKQELIGLAVGQQKNFMIASADAYKDGRDLYYLVQVLVIHYDAFTPGDTDTTATTTTSRTTPVPNYMAPIVIFGGIVLTVVIFGLWIVRSSRERKLALSDGRTGEAIRLQSLQSRKTKLKELRDLTNNMSKVDETTDKSNEVKFRRRK